MLGNNNTQTVDVIFRELTKVLPLNQFERIKTEVNKHQNSIVEKHCDRIITQLGRKKISNRVSSRYDIDGNMFFEVDLIQYDLQLVIKKTISGYSEYSNLKQVIIEVNVKDEVNDEKNRYINVKKALKSVFKHLENRTALSVVDLRRMTEKEIKEHYSLMNKK